MSQTWLDMLPLDTHENIQHQLARLRRTDVHLELCAELLQDIPCAPVPPEDRTAYHRLVDSIGDMLWSASAPQRLIEPWARTLDADTFERIAVHAVLAAWTDQLALTCCTHRAEKNKQITYCAMSLLNLFDYQTLLSLRRHLLREPCRR